MFVIESYTSIGRNGTIGPFATREKTLEGVVRLQDEADPFSAYQVSVLEGLDDFLTPDGPGPWTAVDLTVSPDELWAAEVNRELNLNFNAHAQMPTTGSVTRGQED